MQSGKRQTDNTKSIENDVQNEDVQQLFFDFIFVVDSFIIFTKLIVFIFHLLLCFCRAQTFSSLLHLWKWNCVLTLIYANGFVAYAQTIWKWVHSICDDCRFKFFLFLIFISELKWSISRLSTIVSIAGRCSLGIQLKTSIKNIVLEVLFFDNENLWFGLVIS